MAVVRSPQHAGRKSRLLRRADEGAPSARCDFSTGVSRPFGPALRKPTARQNASPPAIRRIDDRSANRINSDEFQADRSPRTFRICSRIAMAVFPGDAEVTSSTNVFGWSGSKPPALRLRSLEAAHPWISTFGVARGSKPGEPAPLHHSNRTGTKTASQPSAAPAIC